MDGIIGLRNIKRLFFLVLIFTPCVSWTAVPAGIQIERGDTVVLTAMRDELERSQKKLKLEGYENPYFISYQIKDNT